MITEPAAVIAFWVLGALAVMCALGVVISPNLFHAAVLLVGAFLAVAGLYLVLQADFLFGAQILIYGGAIAVLLIFAVMLTQQVQRGNPNNYQWAFALVIAIALLGVMVAVLAPARFPQPIAEAPAFPTTTVIAQGLFGPYILPFELIAVLLLAAMIGAIVIAREERS